MITLTEITTTADIDYLAIKNLYYEAFPAEEILPFDALYQGLKSEECYYKLEKVVVDNQCVGLMSSVETPDFILLFYIATLATVRGGGIGVKLLDSLKQRCSTNRPLIAEVEYVTDETSRRRIGFYERNGLFIQPYAYHMPDQTNPERTIALHMMAWPIGLTEPQFEKINNTLLHQVYK